MCSHRRSDRVAGFTLLECEVALLVLMLLAVGITQLTRRHETLITDMEDVVGVDPVWYVDAPDTQLERTLGLPARLVATAPVGGNGAPAAADPTAVHGIEVLDVSFDLDPGVATALVTLEEL